MIALDMSRCVLCERPTEAQPCDACWSQLKNDAARVRAGIGHTRRTIIGGLVLASIGTAMSVTALALVVVAR